MLFFLLNIIKKIQDYKNILKTKDKCILSFAFTEEITPNSHQSDTNYYDD